MKCAACGTDTPRLTIAQRYCPDCDRRIARTIKADAERRVRRWAAKDLTGAGVAL